MLKFFKKDHGVVVVVVEVVVEVVVVVCDYCLIIIPTLVLT